MIFAGGPFPHPTVTPTADGGSLAMADPILTFAILVSIFGLPMAVCLLLAFSDLAKYIDRRGWRPEHKQKKPNDRP